MATHRERFTTVLTGQYRYLFTLPQYAHAASRYTPEQMAERMVAGLLDGTADKDGPGVRATCSALGIKPNWQALQEFLRRED